MNTSKTPPGGKRSQLFESRYYVIIIIITFFFFWYTTYRVAINTLQIVLDLLLLLSRFALPRPHPLSLSLSLALCCSQRFWVIRSRDDTTDACSGYQFSRASSRERCWLLYGRHIWHTHTHIRVRGNIVVFLVFLIDTFLLSFCRMLFVIITRSQLIKWNFSKNNPQKAH